MSEAIPYVPYYVHKLENVPYGPVCGKYYREYMATSEPTLATCTRCTGTKRYKEAVRNLAEYKASR